MYRGCKQFKYFQDYVKKGKGNGKGVDNEEEGAGECHKVKVYSLDLLSKTTDTYDLIKIPEKKEEIPAEEAIKYETYSFSGYFRDEERRIDLILVFAEDNNPEVKKLQTEFLSSIIKTGLQVELEPGLMPAHRNLTFVKVHAPNFVLEEYGEKLGQKKYFKDIHLEYIQPKIFCCKNREKELLSLVRSNYEKPLNYSNSNRSLLVYKILLNLRFGEHQNNFGLKRLFNRNVISDVYALHDGPYFLTRKQKFSEVNARQILYYKWIGWFDIFTLQPLNLIQEYFGSRVGFYFAFMQFYNLGLAVACLMGIAMTLFGIQDKTYTTLKTDTCNNKDAMICPRCYSFQLCPFVMLKDYCLSAKVMNVIDHYLLPVHCFFLIFWGSAFVILWSRKEKYWLWMWELYNVKNLITTRPEFSINYNKPVQSDSTGLWKYYNSGISKVIRNIVTVVFYVFCILFGLSLFYQLVMMRYSYLTFYIIRPENLPSELERYIMISGFAVVVVIVFTIFEKIFYTIGVYVNRFENHRSIEAYDRALSVKLFVVTCTAAYPILIYFSWFKSRLYLMPGYYISFEYAYIRFQPLKDGFQRNCGAFPCMDEVFVALTVSFLVKQIIPKIIFYTIRFFWPRRTDYNQGKSINKKFPCWEREYRLKSISEDKITAYYNYLALQFGYVILFGATSPLLPVAALIFNLIDIRFTAKEFLLASRRPLLLEKPGLDIWSTLFMLIPLASILSNAVLLSWNSRNAYRHVYISTYGNMTGLLNLTLSRFYTSDYLKLDTKDDFQAYKGVKPVYCYFPNTMVTTNEFDKLTNSDYFYIIPQYVILPDIYEIQIYQGKILIAFHYLGLLIFLLVQFIIPPSPQDIEDSVKAEQNIKDAFLTHSGQ